MVLIAEAQQLKAKLMLKGKFRPEKMVRKKMPDGSGMLAKLPERRKDNCLDAAAADKEYCDAIDKVAAVFGQQKRANSTADEHKRYIRTIDGWLVRKGFGSFVEAEVDKHGQLVAVHARRTASGEIKVMKPQMIIGYLLEMAAGSKDTPKGGHAGDLLARAGQEAVTACGPRSKMKLKKGAMWIDLDEYGHTKIWGPPYRYVLLCSGTRVGGSAMWEASARLTVRVAALLYATGIRTS